jgi:hypothetical protein
MPEPFADPVVFAPVVAVGVPADPPADPPVPAAACASAKVELMARTEAKATVASFMWFLMLVFMKNVRRRNLFLNSLTFLRRDRSRQPRF